MLEVIHSNCRRSSFLIFIKAKCGRLLSEIKSTKNPSKITCHKCLAIERAVINEALSDIERDKVKLMKRLKMLGSNKP